MQRRKRERPESRFIGSGASDTVLLGEMNTSDRNSPDLLVNDARTWRQRIIADAEAFLSRRPPVAPGRR